MTPEQLAALKQQIKAEVINELQQPKTRPMKPWDEVKEIIIPRLKGLGLSHYDVHQTIPAISTIIRHSLNLSRVANMSPDKLKEAKEIATTILSLMEEASKSKIA